MAPDQEASPCTVCITRKVSPASWRYVGESCSHIECPNRRPLTAAPPRDTDGATPARKPDQ